MDQNERRDIVSKETASLEFRPELSLKKQDLNDAVTIPWSNLPAIGVALSSIPKALNEMGASATASEVLYRATDALGNTIPTKAFQLFKDGSGLMGSTYNGSGFSQIRFHPAAQSGVAQPTTMVPFDPATLAIAVALAQINHKLDVIHETQKEMFEYLRRKDRAQQEADLNTLADVLNYYKFNVGNNMYITNKHALVQKIRNRAERNIRQHREEANSHLAKKGLITLGKEASSKSKKVSESMRNYQFALYIYSFSSFLEVMLMGNYDADYLQSMSCKIEEYSFEYRTLYTRCYNALEATTRSTLEANLLGGIALAGKSWVRLLKKRP